MMSFLTTLCKQIGSAHDCRAAIRSREALPGGWAMQTDLLVYSEG